MVEGWRRLTVEKICEQVSVGIVVKPSQYYVDDEAGIKAFRSANISENKVVDKNWVYLSPEGHAMNEKSALKAGDVLVVRSGMPGTACVVTPAYEGANCIDVVFARPDTRYVLPEYLAAFTNSSVGKKHVLGNQGGLALKHFNVGAYKRMEVTLPPLPEQCKIAEILRTWDEAIEAATKLVTALNARREALRTKLVAEAGNGVRPTVFWRIPQGESSAWFGRCVGPEDYGKTLWKGSRAKERQTRRKHENPLLSPRSWSTDLQ